MPSSELENKIIELEKNLNIHDKPTNLITLDLNDIETYIDNLLEYYKIYYYEKNNIQKEIINIIELYKLSITDDIDNTYANDIEMLILNQQIYISLIKNNDIYIQKNIEDLKNKMKNLNQINKIKYLNLLCTYNNI